MRAYEFGTFAEAIDQAKYQLLHRSRIVRNDTWQGTDVSSKPEMVTHELSHVSFQVDLDSMMRNELGQLRGNTIGVLQYDIKPNLPWADDHFLERVCGYPINPGTEWANWPYGTSASRFLDGRGKFNHNYMERYWPRHAGIIDEPTVDATAFKYAMSCEEEGRWATHRGILYEYGDLDDVIKLLAGDPFTRQAYLPVWFPEDTGGGSKRAPCTLGYHFLMRDGKIDVDYHIRSCDYVRHFRDDIYLTCRLLLWVLERAGEVNPQVWRGVRPGKFVMHIGSLHCFVNDYQMLKAGK